jgi:hypothetical protein
MKAIAILLGLISPPALATGTATCAGKTYNDFSYANIDWGGLCRAGSSLPMVIRSSAVSFCVGNSRRYTTS